MKRLFIFAIIVSVTKFLTGCSGTALFNVGYNIRGNKVYYKKPFPGETFEIPQADIKSFRIIKQPGLNENEANQFFAVDKHNVYYRGYELPGSDGDTFTLLDKHFSKDKNQCYFNGEIIPQADPNSFVVKNEVFSNDKNNIYKRTSVIDKDISVFETFDSSAVVRTTNAVSVVEKIVPIPPKAKFKYIKYNYYAIDSQVYFQDKPLPAADIASFKAMDDFFSATSKHVYYGNKIIEHADPASYKLLDGPYGKDAKQVFFFEKTIEGADPYSFEILNLNFQCGRDKNWAYHENIRIKNVTAEDMANKSRCRQCNEEHIYFDGK